jgi:uncharacterized protein YrrD
MLRKASEVEGHAIVASDGPLGTVSDFLFDDASWLVRWLVVETSTWLSRRKVLLPTSALGHLDQRAREFAVRLTMQQVKDSPDVDTDLPVSRQIETNTYVYYGWTPYWGSGGYNIAGTHQGETGGAPPFLGAERRGESRGEAHRDGGDPHLRSTASVTGYHIHASDGEIGHVEDFLIEDGDWSIRYLVVDTKNWWPAKKVLISPRSARLIDWASSLVSLDVDRQRVKDSPAYDASTLVDRAYETSFRGHYADARPNDLR